MRRNQDNPLINAIRGNVPVPRITAPMQNVQVTPRRRGQGPTPQPQRNVVAEQGQRLREQSVQQGRQQWQQLASDPNSIIYVMREVDNRLGTSIGDEARELVKSYALARANRNNSDPRLARYAGEALAMLQAEGGREQLQREIQQFRQRRVDVGPPAPIDRTTRIGQQEFTRGLAQQAGAELEQLQAGQLTPDIVEILREDARAQDEARNPMVRAAATTLGAINPILGSGIQALYGDMAQTNVNRLVDNPAAMMRGDAGVASVIANELVSPATRMTRRFAGPVSEQSEAARAAIALGDIAGQVVMSGGGGGVPAAIARFAALDLPGFGELIATTGSPQAAAEMVGSMARQGLDLRTYADPNIPLDQKIGNAGMALAVAAGSYSALAGARNAMRGASRGLAKVLSGREINRAEATSLQRVASAIQQSDDSIVPPPVLVQQLVERGVPERDAVNVAIINQAGERAIGGTMPADAGEAMARSQVPEQATDVPIRQKPEPTVDATERAKEPWEMTLAEVHNQASIFGNGKRVVTPDGEGVIVGRTNTYLRIELDGGREVRYGAGAVRPLTRVDASSWEITKEASYDPADVPAPRRGRRSTIGSEGFYAGMSGHGLGEAIEKAVYETGKDGKDRMLAATVMGVRQVKDVPPGASRVWMVSKEGGRVAVRERSQPSAFDRSQAHRASVEQALSEGKPVPPEVLADYPDLARTGEPNAPIQEETPSAAQGVLGREEPQPQEQVGLPQARERAGGEGPQAETQAQVAPRTYETLMAEANNLRGAEKRAKIKEARDLRIQEAASGGRMEGASGINPTDLREFYEYAKSYIEDGVDWVRGLRSDFGQDVEPYIESIQRQLDEEGIQVRQVGEEAPQAGQRRPKGTRGMDRAEEAREGGVPAQGEARPEEGFVGSNVATWEQIKARNPEMPDYTKRGTSAVDAFASAQEKGMLARADQIADDIIQKGRMATNEEEVTLAHRLSVLEDQLRAARADYERAVASDPRAVGTAEARINELTERLNNVLQASRVAGTAWHNTGMARQLFLRTMNGVTAMRYRAMQALKRTLTPEESKRIDAFGKKLEDAQKKIAELEERVVRLGALGALKDRAARRGGAVSRERAVQALRDLGAFEPVVGAAPALSPKQMQAWNDLVRYAAQQVKNPSVDNVSRYVRDLANRNQVEMIPDDVLIQIIMDDAGMRRSGAVEAFAPERARQATAREVIDEAGDDLNIGAAVAEVIKRSGGTELEAAEAIKRALGTKRGVQSRRIREVFGTEEEIARLARQFPDLAKAYSALRKERIHAQRLSEEANAYIAKLQRDAEWKEARALQRLWMGTKESFALTRTILTTLDNSIPLRQGFTILTRNPKIWARGFYNSFRSFNSASFDDVMDSLVSRDPEMYDLALAGGLEVPGRMGAVQEDYASHLIQNTVIGAPFRWSQRAADAAMATMRLELFSQIVRGMEEKGAPLNMAEVKEIAKHINVVTGRGEVGRHADSLSVAFLAPRYAKSRLDLLFGLHRLGSRAEGMTPRVKAEVGRSLAQYYATVGAAVAAAYLAGADVETDPRSADFLKAEFKTPNGSVVVDLSGGSVSYAVSVSRLLASTMNLFGADVATDIVPSGELRRPVWDQAVREYVKRAAPIPGALAVSGGALSGRSGEPRNVVGQPTDVGREFARTVLPIQVQSVIQNAREGGQTSEMALAFALEWFGISSQFRGTLGEEMQLQGTYDVSPAEDIRRLLQGEPRPLERRNERTSTRTQQPTPQRSSGPLMRQPLQ